MFETPPPKQFLSIAVVGMGGLFPDASNLTEYWENILNSKDAIQDVPPDFFDIDPYYDPNPLAPDKTYCRRGGVLPAVEFDALEFGIPPKNLEAISLNQLLALKIAKYTLLDARMIGRDIIPYNKDRVGVILGAGVGGNAFFLRERLVGIHHFEDALIHFGLPDATIKSIVHHLKEQTIEWQENSFPGYLPNVVAGRIANRFDFGGVSYAVDAACASSMCAIAQAVYELQTGGCDIVLTGGVSVLADPAAFTSFSKTPALSFKGQIRPFDRAADGMILGDGIGMLVLKRLAEAKKDGDRIYAVIKGIGASSDGRAKSIYAPSLEGQLKALERAYESGTVDPAHVDFIEGHGTGTVAGDLCEVKSLAKFFGRYRKEKQSIALGSVKSQIGHTVQAAGAAATIKAVLALHHRIIPPTINVDEPHPDFALEETPCYLNTKARPWIGSNKHKRSAAVNSFGFGGVNYHLVLEEYEEDSRAQYRINRLPRPLVISAPTTGELLSRCRELKEALVEADQNRIGAIISSFQSTRIPPDHPRLGLVTNEPETTRLKLEKGIEALQGSPDENWRLPSGVFYRRQGLPPTAKIVALFPGQGSQYPDMGSKIAGNFPELQEAFAACDKLYGEHSDTRLFDLVYPRTLFNQEKEAAAAAVLRETKTAQLALAALCSGLYQILANLGFRADMMVGHSFGELTALWAAGAIDTPTFYRLSMKRGLIMQNNAGHRGDLGKMLAVAKPPDDLKAIIGETPDVYISNYNSPAQVVVSGASEAIGQLEKRLAAKGIQSRQLKVYCAFHSCFMKEARKAFEDELSQIPFGSPALTVYSNLTARPYSADTETYSKILAEHLQHPILFAQSIEAAYEAGGRVFVEIGPQRTLSTFVDDILKDRDIETISLINSPRKDSLEQMMEGIARMMVLGIELKEDPYRREWKREEVDPQAKRLTVTLRGQQYLTPETKARIAKARQQAPPQAIVIPREAEEEKETMRIEKDMKREEQVIQVAQERCEDGVLSNSLASLDLIIRNQVENNKLQELFLQGQAREIALIERLTAKHQDLLKAGGNHDRQGLTAIHARNMDYLQKSHNDFYRIHLTFLEHQQEILRQMAGIGQKVTTAVHDASPLPVPPLGTGVAKPAAINPLDVSATLPNAEPAPILTEDGKIPPKEGNSEAIAEMLLAIVSDKTGYPIDMLELSMNVEADLGIDSIKRVEIFSALHEKMPELLDNVNLSDLGDIRTLADIIAYLTASGREGATAPKEAAQPGQNPAAGDTPSSGGQEDIGTMLLAIVSDKTGYPIDMLDLSMNVEADLGIDSIKRVEIFSALHEKMPQLLDNVDLSDLGEVHTLADVIEYLIRVQSGTAQRRAANAEKTAAADPVVRKEGIATRFIVHTAAIGLPHSQKALQMPPGHQILITEDGSGMGIALKRKLVAMGQPVTTLAFTEYPGSRPETADFIVSLAGLSDEAISTLLADIRAKNGPIGGFIHLAPLQPSPTLPAHYVDHHEEMLIKAVFFIAKHLKLPLIEAAKVGRSAFLTVTRIDGQLGMNGVRSHSVIQGGYFGLVKSFKLEAPAVFCRSIDIAPHLDAECIESIIIEELSDEAELPVEVGRASRDTRYTIDKKESQLNGTRPQDIPPDRDTVFLVTGGGRGITARCVEGLAAAFQSRFILLGRTAIDREDPPWVAACPDRESLKDALITHLSEGGKKPTPAAVNRELKNILSRREIRRTLEVIHAHGGQAVYIAADVTRPEKVKERLRDIKREFGPITGIIHGAGNLADKNLEKKSEADFDIVYHTKVTGLKTVLDSVDTAAIRYLVLFSSVSGYYGKDGQADYALSNEILNKLAHAFSKDHPEAVIRSINWGPWDGGMVSSELKEWYRKFQLEVMPINEGVNFLVNELRHARTGNSQIIICPKGLDRLVTLAQEAMVKKNTATTAAVHL